MSKKASASRFGKRRTASTAAHSGNILSCSLRGTMAGIIASAICLTAGTFICLSSEDPDKMLLPTALICQAVGFIASGLFAARRCGSLWGCFLSGAAMTVVFCLLSVFFGGSSVPAVSLPINILIRIIFISLSVLGGLAAKNMGTKKRRARRF